MSRNSPQINVFVSFSEIKKLSAEIHLSSGEVQMLVQRSNPDAQPPNQDLNVKIINKCDTENFKLITRNK
jgi:hypothetical protein